jgi:hypothetical protein
MVESNQSLVHFPPQIFLVRLEEFWCECQFHKLLQRLWFDSIREFFDNVPASSYNLLKLFYSILPLLLILILRLKSNCHTRYISKSKHLEQRSIMLSSG